MLLSWDQEVLANKAGIGVATVRRIEISKEPKEIKNSVRKIVEAFETAGIEFLGSVEENPGIRLNNKKI